jgi:hypothetical protein
MALWERFEQNRIAGKKPIAVQTRVAMDQDVGLQSRQMMRGVAFRASL